ncbi:NUDIX hydrolase [Oceanicella actignis]|uniref:Uncharacterized conserved protein n=1 Tax=Oceanicella actignis TaxID=1189325 RepID=A0A1M7TF82_9RHOB|nr:hypothetical protein [Oceanicella actignis]SET61186.1 Uncharacterized conserved protein [Oceanicella actignis]SHN69422.1 Uncharacterized conserved protein [Oceanicella actignis]
MASARPIAVDLSAVIVALDESERDAQPLALVTDQGRLPSVGYDPGRGRTLALALRDSVRRTTGLSLGYIEQLYTFGDSARAPEDDPGAPHVVSIGYLALTRRGPEPPPGHQWVPWRQFFPWEDRRGPAPALDEIESRLRVWTEGRGAAERERARMLFGLDGAPWRDELTLERYELLYAAELVEEAWRDRGAAPPPDLPRLGLAGWRDNRRILATGVSRLRGKLKYRPVLFELMPDEFTLFELQRAAEAVSGVPLHKQNFRRMVEKSGLLEPTGRTSSRLGGRPAALFRFVSDGRWERGLVPVRFGGARRG